MTVRNERGVLRTNLLYHQFLGVERCYIYDDGSTDDTAESVGDLPFVVPRSSSDSAGVHLPDWLAHASEETRASSPFRQMRNVIQAKAEAAADGFDWTVGIDADELICIDRRRAERGALARALAGQPRLFQGVVFPTLEVLQRRLAYADAMADETWFKRPYKRLQRDTFDPFSNTVRQVRAIYGHFRGKMAVRSGIESYPRSNHRFVKPDGSRLRARNLGNLLHYYSPDANSFVEKFRRIRDHPDHHAYGREVVLQKRLWRDVVNRAGLNDDQLRDYYARWVMFDEHQVADLSRRRLPWLRRGLVEVTSVQDALRQIADERQTTHV
jgi:Glycosyl transferase family 2